MQFLMFVSFGKSGGGGWVGEILRAYTEKLDTHSVYVHRHRTFVRVCSVDTVGVQLSACRVTGY